MCAKYLRVASSRLIISIISLTHRFPNMPVYSLQISCFICVCLFAREVIGVDITCDLDDNPNYGEQSYLIIYQGNSTKFVSTITSISNPEGIKDQFDRTKQSVLYVHGFMQNSNADDLKDVVKAYLDRGDVNVLVLDWGRLAETVNYRLVAKRAPGVGKATAQALNKIADIVRLDTLHVVGHSLGAHVAGYIGRNVETKLSRITGLDAAFPLFYPSECHLNPQDAKFVVTLHTNGGAFGTPVPTGTADFYANGGNRQPACLPVIGEGCSHKRSVRLYAESIRNPKAFGARKCDGTPSSGKDVVYFGDSVPVDTRGMYCFSTNSEPPFGKGEPE